MVICAGPLLILITCGTSASFSRDAATGVSRNILPQGLGLCDLLEVHHCVHSCRQPQMLLPAGVLAITCASLSFGINVLATGLIGYKTWYVPRSSGWDAAKTPLDDSCVAYTCRSHWQLLRENLGRGSSRSLVLKMLALLVESGKIGRAHV